MSRTFTYIPNEDVLQSFIKFRDSLLLERNVVIARHGDYSLSLKCLDRDTLGLTLTNDVKKTTVQSRSYDVNNTTDALVARGVRHAVQKMSELSDEDVSRKRLQIWKWYIMEWQKKNIESTEEFVSRELSWDEEKAAMEIEVMDMERFLHGDYLNLGNTLQLIDSYLTDDKHKEMFRTFAINDIMEMTSEDTKEKSIEEKEKRDLEEGMKCHTYRFTVSVEATDKEHARQALLNYLAGDERIKVQK